VLKRAYKQGVWKAKEKKRCYRKQLKRQEEPEEHEPAGLPPVLYRSQNLRLTASNRPLGLPIEALHT